MPQKLEKLKSLFSLATKAEATYMSLLGGGRLENTICHAIFKWPDVVNCLIKAIGSKLSGATIDDHIDQAIEDISIIIINTVKPIGNAYITASIAGVDQKRQYMGILNREPDKSDADSVMAWCDEVSKIIESLVSPKLPKITFREI